MRIHAIAGLAIGVVAGCSSELRERPAANDPTQVTAAEAPFTRPPPFAPDPLLEPQAERRPGAPTAAGHYLCPMHSDVRATGPGKCPRCGMALRLVEPERSHP